MEHILRAHIQADELPGPIRVKVAGQLTAESCPSLFEVLDPALALEGCPSVTIDLLDITDLDPAGITRLQRYISEHQATGKPPVISLAGLTETPRQHDMHPHITQQLQTSSAADALDVETAQNGGTN